jgi:glycosyltransferase involved in cell wall biosynthesis
MDRAAYAQRVEQLLRDKAHARTLGEAGRRWVNERFGFSSYIDGLENLFRRVSPDATSRASAVSLSSLQTATP